MREQLRFVHLNGFQLSRLLQENTPAYEKGKLGKKMLHVHCLQHDVGIYSQEHNMDCKVAIQLRVVFGEMILSSVFTVTYSGTLSLHKVVFNDKYYCYEAKEQK